MKTTAATPLRFWGETTLTIVDHFSLGWASPALSYVLAVIGCLLGIMLTSKARRRSGAGVRARLLIYATIAFGGIGVWLAQATALLGVNVPSAVVRFSPGQLGLGLLVAVVDVGLGLILITRGHLRARTLIPAGLVIGLGVAATSYTVLNALQVSADVSYDPARFTATIGLCVILAPLALWSLAALRGLLSTVVAAGLLSLVVCGIHYAGQWSLRVTYRSTVAELPGVSPTSLLAPLLLGGVMVTVMLAYFTVGSSTLHELRNIYGPHDNTDSIEPWLIEEVTERVISGTKFSPVPIPGEPTVRFDAPRQPSRPRPTPGIRPSWQRMSGRPVDQADRIRNDAEHRRVWPVSAPRPVDPIELLTVDSVVIGTPEEEVFERAQGAPLPRRQTAASSQAEPYGDGGTAVIIEAHEESSVQSPPDEVAELPRRGRNQRS